MKESTQLEKILLKLNQFDRNYLNEWVCYWVRMAGKKVTWEQHKYYRGYLLPRVSEIMGHDEAELHLAFKWFLPGGKESTSQLTTQEMTQYQETIIRKVAENYGVVLLFPDEFEREMQRLRRKVAI